MVNMADGMNKLISILFLIHDVALAYQACVSSTQWKYKWDEVWGTFQRPPSIHPLWTMSHTGREKIDSSTWKIIGSQKYLYTKYIHSKPKIPLASNHYTKPLACFSNRFTRITLHCPRLKLKIVCFLQVRKKKKYISFTDHETHNDP